MSAQPSLPIEDPSQNDSQIVPSEAAASVDDPSMSDLERDLVKRLKTGRAALPVLPAVAQSAIRLANDPDARITDLASLVESLVETPRTLAEISGPVDQRFADSGTTDDQLSAELEQAKHDMRADRRGRRAS